MYRFLVFLFASIVSLYSFSSEIKYLDDIMNKATKEEKKDLVNLLKQIRFLPSPSKKSGRSLMKVTFVEKGSVFEREGIQVGDFVISGSSSDSLELKSQLKKTSKNR